MTASVRTNPLRRLYQVPGLSAKLTIVGLLITSLFVAMALLAPVLQGAELIQDPTASLINPIHQPPSAEHWFGTSQAGYDVFSRTLYGAQAALKVVLLATVLSLIVGVPLGLLSGYLGG